MGPSTPDGDACGVDGAPVVSAAERTLRTLARPVPPAFPWAAPFLTVGVTGTNGKTSTTHLLASIFRAAALRTVCESTLGYFLDDRPILIERSIRGFYSAMQRAAAEGHRHAAIEVTSKALAFGYAEKWRFDHAIFTNLTRDHVAEHGSFEHYLASKAQLFVHLGPGCTAALNACDEGALLIDRAMPSDVRRVWYGAASRGVALRAAELSGASLEPALTGTRVELAPSPLAEALGGALTLGLIGEVYGENALGAAALALTLGLSPDAVHQGLEACSELPGRFEIVHRRPYVVLDYAHTPDALARVCDTARRLAGAARVLVVFGAAGGYDSPKRAAMGQAVGSRADLAFVTNENPRHEDPAAIIRAVAEGCRAAGRARVRVMSDRRAAIAAAVDAARDGDFVLVTGRGRDEEMVVGGEVFEYSDVRAVGLALGGAAGHAGSR